MSGINKVIIIGHLGADPEVKTIGNGNTVANMSVATSESWVDKEGQRQEKTEWHRIAAWGKLAEICGKHLHKGRQVYVEGRLQTRSWEDQQGQKRYMTEIVAQTVQFLGGAGDRKGVGADAPAAYPDFGPEPSFDNSDQLPF